MHLGRWVVWQNSGGEQGTLTRYGQGCEQGVSVDKGMWGSNVDGGVHHSYSFMVLLIGVVRSSQTHKSSTDFCCFGICFSFALWKFVCPIPRITHSIGGSVGSAKDMRPLLGGPNSFNFMQFWGKNWPNNSFSHPHLELVHPSPQGNPGSATAWDLKTSSRFTKFNVVMYLY